MLVWKNEFAEIFAKKYQIATEAAWGGARTMYPDYLESGARVTDEGGTDEAEE